VYRCKKDRLTPKHEKNRYKAHQNHLDNPGYKEFLSPAIEALKHMKKLGAKGLDYGCGPTEALARLARNEGFQCDTYDPFFFPKKLENLKPLDFILCTEAAEHFFNPQLEFEKIFSLLKPDGCLILMTELHTESTDFESWYYAKDPTHVSFYSELSIDWISEKHQRGFKALSPRLQVLFTN
jgi:SAM-dependent methyltransferase